MSIKRFAFVALLLAFWNSSSGQSIVDSLGLSQELSINFAVDEHVLINEHKEVLDILINKYQDKDAFFEIEAHTDSDGALQYNDDLSLRRMESVLAYLRASDISEENIQFSSYGERNLLLPELDDSGKSKNRRCEIRVYEKMVYALFSGIALDDETYDLIEASITVQYDSLFHELKSDTSKGFSFYLPQETSIFLEISSKGYFPIMRELKLNSRSNIANVKFYLTKLEMNRSLKTNIQFEGNKSIILKKSLPEVETLTNALLNAAEICIELEGHIHTYATDVVPENSFEHGLSIARSLEIQKLMVEAGIEKNRMIAKGYGNSQLLFPNAIRANETSANRRVELRVISCDSSKVRLDDSIPNPELYKRDKTRRKIPTISNEGLDSILVKKFGPTTLNDDLRNLSISSKRRIISQLKHMRTEGADPTQYTYGELLNLAISRSGVD